MAKWTAEDIPTQAGKVAVVTGANIGIGYHTALELARHGAIVILGCRAVGKGKDAVKRIQEQVPGAKVEFHSLNLADLGSVRQFAQEVSARFQTIDLLINNAGIMGIPERLPSVDGYETQFATNHLGHFALTALLMPNLLNSPSPRVVTVSSLAHARGTIKLDDLNSEKSYDAWAAYSASKLANLLFAYELDRRSRKAGSNLLSIAVHPGVAKTNILSSGPTLGTGTNLRTQISNILAPLFGQSDAQGALPSLYAATAPRVEGGEYYGPDGFMGIAGLPVKTKSNAVSKDPTLAAKLWEASEKLTKTSYGQLSRSAR
jgi:NAD(P)-dependent dehydrogenase (short-subunit alcohol dehydrogenase family)